MKIKNYSIGSLLALIPFLFVGADEGHSDGCHGPATIISSVRVFDGENIIEDATVVLHCDHVKKVLPSGEEFEAGPDDKVLDGEGKTLIPGLIDSHTHVFNRGQLERSLDFGVTTSLDMGSLAKGFAKAMKAEREQGPVTDRSELRSAALWVTAPGSHGTQFGEVETLVDPKDADAFVARRIEDGADYIKIIYDNFKMIPREIPTLSKETMEATVAAAHKYGKMAVVHSRDVDAYADVIAAGANGFVHVPIDAVPDEELVAKLVEGNLFVGPNLSLATGAGKRLVEDPYIGPRLTDSETESLKAFRNLHPNGGDIVALETVSLLHQAGVPILAGSDASNAGTTYGASMHLELELLVERGLSPIDALKAATSVPAQMYGLSDRGRIAHELQADLILVNGKPDEDIKDTRNIVAIWKSGKQLNLDTPAEQ